MMREKDTGGSMSSEPQTDPWLSNARLNDLDRMASQTESRPDPRVEPLARAMHAVHVNCVGQRCDPDGDDMNAWHPATALLAAIDASPDIALVERNAPCRRCRHSFIDHPAGPCQFGEGGVNCHCRGYIESAEARSSRSDVPDERSRLLRAGHVGMLDKTAAEPHRSELCDYADPCACLCAWCRHDHIEELEVT